MNTIDINDPALKNIHIIGIGGAGMSAIATVLIKMGKNVTGSDLKQSHVTERLASFGVSVNVPHDRSVINSNIDLVVKSTAINDENEEIVQARKNGISVVSRSQMLSAICKCENSIGVAGSHGKTTTTSMLTSIARAASLNPSFMIGGDVNEIGTNAGYTSGSLLIVEADESDKTFLDLDLVGAIVTNIENDHLESYENSFDELLKSFDTFINNVNGPVVICVDEPNSRKIAENSTNSNVITIGSNDADWTYNITKAERGGISATLKCDTEEVTINLAVPGIHNIKNACCAFILMKQFGVQNDDAITGLSTFGGVARRFQFRGETDGIIYVDDYAHLPTEISATLNAAKDGEFSKIVSIFQPHRFSRTIALYKEFAEALMPSDVIGVCDIYSAGEEPRLGVTSDLIVDEIKLLGHNNVKRLSHIEDVVSFVYENARPGDIVLTLGAGDITMYPDIIQSEIKAK